MRIRLSGYFAFRKTEPRQFWPKDWRSTRLWLNTKLLLKAFLKTGDTICATVNGETRSYATILGCDGSRSAVRDALGLTSDGYDLDEEWSIADLEIPEWHDRRFRVSVMDGGELSIVIPMAKGRYRLVASEPDALQANPIPLPDFKVRRAGSFRIGIRQVSTYNVGNAWLAGDAAHTHSPVGGRGMNLGIADASEWVQRYVDGTLSEYSMSRHKVGAATIKFTEDTRKMLQDGSDFKRDALLFAVRGLGLMTFVHPIVVHRMLMGEF